MSTRFNLRINIEKWPLIEPFRITGYTFYDLDIVVVTLQQEELVGRGEAAGVYYFNDDVPKMACQIEAVQSKIEAGITREELQEILPAGGARNAVDCALWDLEAKRSGQPAWQLAGLEPPKPILTTYTIGADPPEKMAKWAHDFKDARALKLKLTGEPVDVERVRAVREMRPDVWLGVDANQGFTRASLESILPLFIDMRVALIEQPLRIGQEADLEGLASPIPIAADESVQVERDIESLVGRFNVINIKLDKSGGLTEALKMAATTRRLGLDLMVGNMTGTSLAMAPAFLIGQLCQVVDLDGPICLCRDREPAIRYENGTIWSPQQVWGGTA